MLLPPPLQPRIAMYRIDHRGKVIETTDDVFIFGPVLIAPDARSEIVVIQVQAIGDGFQMLHLQRVPGEDYAEGVVIIDNDAAVSIENGWSASGTP